jgi:DNA recombination protein RmuC
MVVALLVTLGVGALLGWFAGSRATAALRAERDRRESDFKAAIADLAAAEERATMRHRL